MSEPLETGIVTESISQPPAYGRLLKIFAPAGALVQRYGWDVGFEGLIIVTVIGTILFIAAWPAKAHGYES